MKEHDGETERPGVDFPAARQAPRGIVLHSRDDVCTTVVELARQASHSLLLHTVDLEAAIFDQRPFIDAVTRLVMNHRDACLHILIQDGRKAIQCSNRLIELSRRLSTQIQLRRPAAQHRDCHKTILLSDRGGYLLCPLPGRYEGEASLDNPGKVQDLKKYLTEVWEHAEPDVEMRRLDL